MNCEQREKERVRMTEYGCTYYILTHTHIAYRLTQCNLSPIYTHAYVCVSALCRKLESFHTSDSIERDKEKNEGSKIQRDKQRIISTNEMRWINTQEKHMERETEKDSEKMNSEEKKQRLKREK